MSRPNRVRSTLQNFLESYASRNSDREGYWLMGFLVDLGAPLEIDLLSGETGSHERRSVRHAIDMARQRLGEIATAERTLRLISSARLRIEQVPGRVEGETYEGTPRSMVELRLGGLAALVGGQEVRADVRVFAARHDPALESQSCRFTGPSSPD